MLNDAPHGTFWTASRNTVKEKPLHHAHRIYLQRNRSRIAARIFELLHRLIDHGAHLLTAGRFHQQLNAMLAAQASEWRRRGAEDAARMSAVRVVKRIPKLLRSAQCCRRFFMTDQQERERHERRIAMVSTVANLFFVEPAIVLRRRMPQGVMMRMISLDEYATRQVSATRATGDLGDYLKRSFRSAKVRQAQACIDGNDTDQGHVRKVVTFREHLGSDEQVGSTFSEIQGGLFKPLWERSFGLPLPSPDEIVVLAAARRTRRRGAPMMVAVVADQRLIAAVIGERHVAVRAFDRFAARAAKDEARIAATI